MMPLFLYPSSIKASEAGVITGWNPVKYPDSDENTSGYEIKGYEDVGPLALGRDGSIMRLNSDGFWVKLKTDNN